eukprot:scaffold46304_cov183-Amphora_coffeaeformis.AAC.1
MDVLGWWESLPRVTQVWLGASLAVHAAVTLDVLAPEQLLFDGPSIYYDWELWRLLTSFLYTGGMLNEFPVLIALYMITLHSSAYEKNPHPVGGNRRRRSASPRADYAFCLGFCMTLTTVSYLVVDYFEPKYSSATYDPLLYPLFARTLIDSVMYLWSRRNPDARINLNMIPLQGQYLPFAHLGLSLMLGNHVGDLVHGMLVGHTYYYLVHVVPAMTGRHVLTTPRILVDWLGEDNNHVHHMQHEEEDNLAMRRFRDEGATPAHIAAKLGHLDEIRRLAAQDRTMMRARDRNNWQPLHEAVRGGHTQVVYFLLDMEDVVNVNTVTAGGDTPLTLADTFHGPNHPITIRLRQVSEPQSESSSGVEDDESDEDDNDDDSNEDEDHDG